MPLTRMLAVNETLRQLGYELGSGQRTLSQHLDAVADLLQVSVGCSRVTVWLLQREDPGSALVCSGFSSFSRSMQISRCALPDVAVRSYLDALLATGVLAVHQVASVPDLQVLNAVYCAPEGVLATLDAAFVVNGQAMGVVCCEQIGASRRWDSDEVALLRRVAQVVTLDLARLAGGLRDGDDCDPDIRRLMLALAHPLPVRD